jgi:glycosyltransferase involved in cell wall biosynthesis
VRYIANEIWPKLKIVIPNIEINIIGAGAPSDLVKLSEAEESFNVLGFVDDLKPYLDNATVYVCPIDDGGGTKLKLLDAFASGKAVVAHQVACEGLRVEDGKQVLIANDPNAYVQQIQKIINDKALRQKLEKNAREHAENHFSFSSIGKQLADHFSSLR